MIQGDAKSLLKALDYKTGIFAREDEFASAEKFLLRAARKNVSPSARPKPLKKVKSKSKSRGRDMKRLKRKAA